MLSKAILSKKIKMHIKLKRENLTNMASWGLQGDLSLPPLLVDGGPLTTHTILATLPPSRKREEFLPPPCPLTQKPAQPMRDCPYPTSEQPGEVGLPVSSTGLSA